MTTIITYGTFDLFHIGHLNLLKRLANLGDRLIVACSTDEFNQLKGKKTVVPYAHRASILQDIRYVHKVIPETCWEQKRDDILRENADIFAIGDDWAGKFDDLKDVCQVIYLPRTEDVSTTEIRQMVSALHADKAVELRQVVDRLKFLVEKL